MYHTNYSEKYYILKRIASDRRWNPQHHTTLGFGYDYLRIDHTEIKGYNDKYSELLCVGWLLEIIRNTTNELKGLTIVFSNIKDVSKAKRYII